MHWCPDCGEACFCDCDDTDYGTFNCKIHDGVICREELEETLNNETENDDTGTSLTEEEYNEEARGEIQRTGGG